MAEEGERAVQPGSELGEEVVDQALATVDQRNVVELTAPRDVKRANLQVGRELLLPALEKVARTPGMVEQKEPEGGRGQRPRAEQCSRPPDGSDIEPCHCIIPSDQYFGGRTDSQRLKLRAEAVELLLRVVVVH
ncbi:hypothetical protein GCM10012280_54720 [Wenjunlia tyrosinilytica]|uniref:Uncharacterized protein n=1 Tax=Wenjunlia tyrosinilytica TaxID=1544741 RepID=A0A917ZWW5_9ACTN|nr:hypothetical protein GCM10012280_54720 [Wenjunlia tyrosinilytica]